MTEIETQRLRLRPIAPGDLPALAAMFADSDVMRFLPTGEPRSPEETQAELDYMMSHWRERGFGVWAVILKDTGEFAGYCGLQYLHVEPGGVSPEALRDGTDVEVVAGLAKRFWAQGIAPEAARAALRYGFETLGLPRIVAAIHPDNGASRHILEGMGMKEDPSMRYYGITPHFVLRREEWQPNQTPPPPERMRRASVTIRRATPDDAASVRALRLEALATEPIAFSADYEANARDPASKWGERIAAYAADNAGLIAVADAGGELVGMVGMARGHWPKTRHIGEFWGVYVKPAWRGLRVCPALIEECAAWAREHGIVILKLGVAEANAPAVRCYTRCGFTVSGRDLKALCVYGVYYDEFWMARML